MAREDEIKLIAYNLWEEEGCPEGRECEHWYRAEIIWQEQQKPNASIKTSNMEPKQMVKPTRKVAAAKKKSSKT
jgi:hypothetical protein